MVVVAGIDVSKVSLEVWAGDGPAQRFDNSTDGIAALVEWLKGQCVSVAVCEPTGGYERQLISQQEEAGLSAYMVHPNKVRSFARACGYAAKTDGLDAGSPSATSTVFGRDRQPPACGSNAHRS